MRLMRSTVTYFMVCVCVRACACVYGCVGVWVCICECLCICERACVRASCTHIIVGTASEKTTGTDLYNQYSTILLSYDRSMPQSDL